MSKLDYKQKQIEKNIQTQKEAFYATVSILIIYKIICLFIKITPKC